MVSSWDKSCFSLPVNRFLGFWKYLQKELSYSCKEVFFIHYFSPLSGLISLFCVILISLSLTYSQKREESLTKRAGVRSQCMCKFNWIHRKMSVLEADQSISASKYPHGLLQKMKNGNNRNLLTGLFLRFHFLSCISKYHSGQCCNAEGLHRCDFELVSHRLLDVLGSWVQWKSQLNYLK